jgi:hypothetical protein
VHDLINDIIGGGFVALIIGRQKFKNQI